MGTYKQGAPGTTRVELNSVPSTEQLVIVQGRTRGVLTGHRRLEICLLVFCTVLLVVCVVLAVFLALEITNRSEELGGIPSTNGVTPSTTGTPQKQECKSAECLKISAFFAKNLNESVDPCDDFFHYSCDGWIRDNPIPPSRNEWVTFLEKIQENRQKLRNLLEDATGLYDDPVMKAKRYYKSCMNEEEVERTTDEQMLQLIRSLGSWSLDEATWNKTTPWNWTTALLTIQASFVDKSPLFALQVVVDPRHSSENIIKLLPTELSLIPNQYINNDTESISAYLDYMTKVGILLGGDNSTTRKYMQQILDLEADLARVSPSKRELYAHYYDTMTVAELQEQDPHFNWLDYLNGLFLQYNTTLNSSETMVVPSAHYLRNVTQIAHDADPKTLSNYFIWTILKKLVPFLSTPFRQAEDEYKKKATGTKVPAPRWQSCVTTTDYYQGLTFATGSLYVEKVFDKKIIPLLKETMDAIREAFREEVSTLEWIDKETRPKLYRKEEAMVEKIGYPEMCLNKTLLSDFYGELEIDERRYLLNEVNVTKWYTAKSLAKLRKKAMRSEWFMGPLSVNAFYLRERNEINILAGILQPPFYHGRMAPRAVNFGGVGMVLAHELTHGFDNVGREFNMYGERGHQWWSNYTLAGFKNRSKCLVDQYSKYYLGEIKGRPRYIDGSLTLGENIADNGGMRITFKAYKNWLEKHGPEENLPGLQKTNAQMFFISYAQQWCSKFSPAAIFRRSIADTHSLPYYRVNGVVSSMAEFSEAFKCPLGSKMNPKQPRCRVW